MTNESHERNLDEMLSDDTADQDQDSAAEVKQDAQQSVTEVKAEAANQGTDTPNR